MTRPTILANAVGTAVATGYVLCRLIAVVAPGCLFDGGQSWFHTLNREATRATGPTSPPMFVLGLVSSVAVSRAGMFATAELDGRWTRAGDR
jgi:hypothetical protein